MQKIKPNKPNKLKYENVFKGRMGTLYARLFNPETNTTETKVVTSIPPIYINENNPKEKTNFISIPEKKPLKEITFKTLKEYKDTVNLYQSSGVLMYGNKSQEQNYIRENWPNPIDSYHDFGNMWFWDIETAVDLNNEFDKNLTRDDWKPMGHERAAMATITSIQIYDTGMKMFFIFALNKDWTRQDLFKSNHGPVKYIKCSTEEEMLKKFLGLLSKRDPALMSGWNTAGYDDPFVTNRVIRVLDKRDDLYYYDKTKQMWKFNTDCLEGGYVKQLSPHAGLIKHKEIKTNFGIQDEFKWVGIIQEDYLEMYKKYTYTTHTSYSLDNVASYELGNNKVNHDEFTDFAAFYTGDYKKYAYDNKKEEKNELDNLYLELVDIDNELAKISSQDEELSKLKEEKKRQFEEAAFDQFVTYGLRDVELLVELDQKLKLINLAQFIAYTCGVCMPDVKGTVKQWNSYMYNNHLNKKQVLPLEGKFGHTDTTVMNHAVTMKDIDEDRRQNFMRLLSSEETHGQAFPGGITRGTGRFWKEVFSLDFGSLYPSAIQWANIGIETLIEPKDLPEELLDLRARYANFYPKDVAPKDLIQFDFRFANNVLGNETIRKEIEETLNKHNVCMTPNGMFFSLNERSVLSQTMEDIIVQRKVHKKNMLNTYREMQAIEDEINSLKEQLNNKEA